ncbi:MAG: hypothetical protein AAGD88_10490 [Bacteroidota bacterium]
MKPLFHLPNVLSISLFLLCVCLTNAQDCEPAELLLLEPKQIITTLQDNDKTKHQPLEIEEGRLKVIASGQGYGWFSDGKGPLLFELLNGDFMIETEVQIKRKNGKKGLPKGNYSSAGILIRNPNSTYAHETWLMYNVGVQKSFYGNEIKVTRPLGAHKKENTMYYLGMHSLSTLFLIPQAHTKRLKLRVAKIGDELRCYFNTGENWVEQKPDSKMELLGNGKKVPVSQFDESQFRPNELNLTGCLQVGLVVNPGYDVKNLRNIKRDGYALFSYYKRKAISDFSEALAD